MIHGVDLELVSFFNFPFVASERLRFPIAASDSKLNPFETLPRGWKFLFPDRIQLLPSASVSILLCASALNLDN